MSQLINYISHILDICHHKKDAKLTKSNVMSLLCDSLILCESSHHYVIQDNINDCVRTKPSRIHHSSEHMLVEQIFLNKVIPNILV